MNQLPKNSLRFFFDTPEKDAELHRMSEIGVYHLPPLPSFQLDRARLEQDLIDMNVAMGIDVQLGATVRDVVLDKENGHRVVVERGGEKRAIPAKDHEHERAIRVDDCIRRCNTHSNVVSLKLCLHA
jgi:flavin-dependent dehydrogenase